MRAGRGAPLHSPAPRARSIDIYGIKLCAYVLYMCGASNGQGLALIGAIGAEIVGRKFSRPKSPSLSPERGGLFGWVYGTPPDLYSARQARGVAQCARRLPQAVAWAARAVLGRPQRRLPRPRVAARSAAAPCAVRLWRLCLPSTSRPRPAGVGAAPVCARPSPRLAASLFGHFPQSCRLWLCSAHRALASVVANVALEPVMAAVTSITRFGKNHSNARQ